MSSQYPDVSLSHMYIDNAVMQMVRKPKQFDVILTSNMFGDILSDEASMVTGSIGMLPSASLASESFGMYEPIHGSAPDIAGLDQANPMATILSVAMMLRYSFNLLKEAEAIERAVERVLSANYRTPDIMSKDKVQIGTKQAGDLIAAEI
jgi:3-isopropylmalate dehydrogenase